MYDIFQQFVDQAMLHKRILLSNEYQPIIEVSLASHRQAMHIQHRKV